MFPNATINASMPVHSGVYEMFTNIMFYLSLSKRYTMECVETSQRSEKGNANLVIDILFHDNICMS